MREREHRMLCGIRVLSDVIAISIVRGGGGGGVVVVVVVCRSVSCVYACVLMDVGSHCAISLPRWVVAFWCFHAGDD